MSAFDALRHIDRAQAPDERFARRLRLRVVEALAPTVQLPERTRTMADTTTTAATDAASHTTGAIHPYIAVDGAAAAIDWYVAVLGATETLRYVGDDGRIGHAEVTVGSGRLMISDEYPDFGALSPATVGGTPVKLYAEIDDVDAAWQRALDGGAEGRRPPEDQAYGRRSCAFRDPFGHEWMVQSGDPTTDEIQEQTDGFTIVDAAAEAPDELAYVTLTFGDTERARAFYGELFGWRAIEGASGPGFAHVDNTRLPIGMAPGDTGAPPLLYIGVSDLDASADRVVALGGRVIERSEYASGRRAVECEDDQGRRFTLISADHG